MSKRMSKVREEEMDVENNSACESSGGEEEEEDNGSSDEEGPNIEDIILQLGLRSRLRMMGNLENQVEPLVQDDSNYSRLMYWTCVQDSGFPNRVNHAVATHQDEKGNWYTYSFGGYHADDDERTVLQADHQGGPFFKSSPIDVHVCDVATLTWTCLKPPPANKYFNVQPMERGPIPGCRYGHTACSYKGRVYMYGGRNDEDGSFSDVSCYDIKNNIWLKLQCTGYKPQSRDGHACTSIGPLMFVHGGFSATAVKFSGDTFVFNMETHEWDLLPSRGCRVPERDFHTATAVVGSRSRKLVIFGGRSDRFAPYFTANDVYDKSFYTYNIDSHKWKHCEVTGYQPSGRRSHCAVSIGTNVLFFGGYNAYHKQHFGDVFCLDTETWHVTEFRPFGSNPSPRRRVGCAHLGSQILICGGTSPVMVERDGKQKEILHDHNDVFILHLVPTLQQLSVMAIIQHQLSFNFLPPFVRNEIEEQSGKKLITITPRSVQERSHSPV